MNLRDQKGLTGVDVVISIVIISITTVAILMLYTNIVVGSKNVNRTTKATKIATSILENVDNLYFAEFEEEFYKMFGLYCNSSKNRGQISSIFNSMSSNDIVELLYYKDEATRNGIFGNFLSSSKSNMQERATDFEAQIFERIHNARKAGNIKDFYLDFKLYDEDFREIELEEDRINSKYFNIVSTFENAQDYFESRKVFDVLIQDGYKVSFEITPFTTNQHYGFNPNTETVLEGVPLFFEVKVIVDYTDDREAGNPSKQIVLQTLKKREMLDECNEPDIDELVGRSFGMLKIKDKNQVQPIRWSEAYGSYEISNTKESWYNYSSGEFAKVILKDLSSREAIIESGTSKVKNIDNNKVLMWIPRYGNEYSDGSATQEPILKYYAYGASNDKIKRYTVFAGNDSKTFSFFGVAIFERTKVSNGSGGYNLSTNKVYQKESIGVNTRNFPEGSTGVWVDISGGGARQMDIIDNSPYGVPVNHIEGKRYY